METVCQVNFDLMTHKEAIRAEAILREYLLRVCDQVSMTRVGSSPLSFFSLPHGFQIRRFIRMLKSEDVAEKNPHKSAPPTTPKITSAPISIISRVILFFSSAMPHSTPGRRVEVNPRREQKVRKALRSSIGFSTSKLG